MRKYFLTLIFIFMNLSVAYAANENSPAGYWETIDDVSGMVQSVVRITENSNGSLTGTVVRIYPHKGQSVNDVCSHCEGERHNQRIWGMTILSGMEYDGSKWTGGNILDPTTGKTYHCVIHVLDNGKKLDVRGYIGLPFIGRSQTWLRVG